MTRIIAPVDAKVLATYGGSYRLNPTQILVVTLEGDQLFAKITEQQKIPLFPMSDRQFFVRTSDECIVFSVDSRGRVTSLTQLHFGVEDVAVRIDDAEVQGAK